MKISCRTPYSLLVASCLNRITTNHWHCSFRDMYDAASGILVGLIEIEGTNSICRGRPSTTCPMSGFTEEYS
ncbi:hypothetical protein VPH35_028612 [Triticum aestivum]